MNKIQTLRYAFFVTAIALTTLSNTLPLYAEQKPKSNIEAEIAAWNAEIEADRQNAPAKLKAWKEEVDRENAELKAEREASERVNDQKLAALREEQKKLDQKLEKFGTDKKEQIKTTQKQLLEKAAIAAEKRLSQEKLQEHLVPVKRLPKATDVPPAPPKTPEKAPLPPSDPEVNR